MHDANAGGGGNQRWEKTKMKSGALRRKNCGESIHVQMNFMAIDSTRDRFEK